MLEKYRTLERLLYRADVREFFLSQDKQTLTRFVELRREVTLQVGSLTVDRLNAIADELRILEPEFKEGAKQLEDAINELQNAVRILGAISTILGIVGRVIAFAI